MKRVIACLFSLGLIFTSCDDYLDKNPLNSPSDQTFLRTEKEMNMALAGCYYHLWTNHETMTFFLSLDILSDVNYDRNVNLIQPLAQGAADPKNGYVEYIWKCFYSGIAKCNYLIQNMHRGQENVQPATYNKINAEARFLRSLYYSYLIELYGDIPLVTEPLTLETSQKARTPKAEIVDFILNELTAAAEVLPENVKPTSGHASKGAALALKARTALYNERWQDAIDASQQVMAMEGSQYALEPEYATLFTNAGEGSKEIIFSVQYLLGATEHAMYRLNASRNAKGFTNKKPPYQLIDSWECTDGLSIDKSPLYDPAKPFVNRDPRLGYTVAVPGSVFLGYQFETHGDSLKCWYYPNGKEPVRVDNLEATHAYATFTGFCWRKYCNIEDQANNTKCTTNTIMIRYAEVLLTYAEAKIKAGQIDQSVLDAINKVRQRPSVKMPPVTTTDPTELFYKVCKERKYELAGEGLRLFDIRRWKIAHIVMNSPVLGRMKKSYPTKAPRIDEYGNAFYDENTIAQPGESSDFKMRLVDKRTFNKDQDYLWPIPYIEIQTNKALTQNPNYN